MSMRILFMLILSMFVFLGSNCSDQTSSTELANPEFTIANRCGLEKDPFFIELYAQKLSLSHDESVKLRHEQFMERLHTEMEETDSLIGEAFSKIGEREERFRKRAEGLIGKHNSVDCVYLKLRIAEILTSN